MINKCNGISESCQYCVSYRRGACYYGPKLLILLFGPMYNVPKTGWCNRFKERTR